METINITLTRGEALQLLSCCETQLEIYSSYGPIKNRKVYERILNDQSTLIKKIRQACAREMNN